MNYENDLNELDRIWPLGKQLIVPDGGSVLVAGAYEGRYMDYVATRFKPGKALGYEPQVDKVVIAEERLRRHGPVTKLFGLGVGVQDCITFMEEVGTDGCKVCRAGPAAITGKLKSIDAILDEHGPFDLFICNMEGYEYTLLAHMWAHALLPEIGSLAVQFHSPDNMIVPTMLTGLYGAPVYNDFPTWTYWAKQ